MFNMKFKFSILGVVIFMLPMLINIVYFMYPPVNSGSAASSNSNQIIGMVENISRALYAVAICILVSKETLDFKSPWFYIGIVFLVLYYIVWIRYFIGGRDVALLGKSFLFVPQPLAVFPVLYFICAAIWLHNYAALILMLIFGAAHNINSYISLNK